MVSLWPWKAEGNDASAFEKQLSTIATKITKTTTLNASLHSRARRGKTMVTLWGGFAYILVAVISVLVTGWRNWGAVEYSVVAGGPVALYSVRRAITVYYDYRLSKTQAYLDSLYKERDTTIDRLKSATKYNSTQQLLEKYGEPRPSAKRQQSSPGKQRGGKGGPQQQRPQQPQRTNMAPPATANIPRNQPGSSPGAPQRVPSAPSTPQNFPPRQPPPYNQQPPPQSFQPTEEFAPNAFSSAPPQYAPASGRGGWLDRMMDALMGEDETLSRNRIALICQHCRLVNGQAPPGAVTPADIGVWRCGSCGGWNGEESEVGRIVRGVKKEVEEANARAASDVKPDGEGSAKVAEKEPTRDEVEEEEDEETEEDEEEEASAQSDDAVPIAAPSTSEEDVADEPPSRSTRSKRGRGKGRRG